MIARQRRRFRHWLNGPKPPRRPDLCQPFIAVPRWIKQSDGSHKNVGGWIMPEELEVVCRARMDQYDAQPKRIRLIHGIFGALAQRYDYNLVDLISKHGAAWRSAPEEIRNYLSRQYGFIAVEDL